MFFKLRRERVRITNLVGEGDQVDDILAKQFNLPRDQITAMVRRLESRDISLDARAFEDSSTSLLETLPASTKGSEEQASSAENSDQIRDVVRTAIDSLDDRERYIVESRLMADAEDELSLAEIGRKLGVSRERARQLEARAKKKLRQRIVELSGDIGRELFELETAA
jgi:RNA polymerase sigma-32 factor